MNRIKFYKANDLAFGYYLNGLEKILFDYKNNKKEYEINDLIEIYNIKKYIDYKVFPLEWDFEKIREYESVIKKLYGLVAIFFNNLDGEKFILVIRDVDIEYMSDFWEIFDRFNCYLNIASNVFLEFINSFGENCLIYILRHKGVTEYYGSTIREYMLSNKSSAEILLDKYEMKHIAEQKTIYFPKELSNRDKEIIINNYIENDDANLNYLRLIANIQSNKDRLELSSKTLLKAKKKTEEYENNLFDKNTGMLMETNVTFSSIQDDPIIIELKGQALNASYSIKWIDENNDFATLLNNFIYIFSFVDCQMRCTLVNKVNEMGVFERFIFTSSINAYKKGIAFDRINLLALLQMSGYYNHLFSTGIRVEDIFNWFFKEYMLSEFNVNNFKIIMPSAHSTYLEKCTNIMPALEYALKQFTMYVQDKYIDFELLEIRTEHLVYKDIPSLVNNKYVYGHGKDFTTITYLLFSDQSGLSYNESSGKSYNNFYERIRNESYNINNVPNFSIAQINWLIEKKILVCDKNNDLSFSNITQILILKDLYFNDVICYWKYHSEGRENIDLFASQNIVEFESTLFSKPEQDYLNYILNKSKFNNGLDLRNKYSHTQVSIRDNDNIHYQNYMIFLIVFAISVIKINDDFCTLDYIKLIK